MTKLMELRLGGDGAVVARLGAPLIAFFLVQTIANLFCLAFLGHLGTATLAGVGAGSAIYGVVLALLFGVDTSVQALVSRAVGAGDERQAGQILIEALTTAIPLGVGLSLALWGFGPSLLAGMLSDPAAAAAGAANLRALAPSIALLALTIPINAAWIGSGRPAIAFGVTMLTASIQVGLSYVLVVGVGPVPSYGAGGAGMASALGCLAGGAVQLVLASRLRLIPSWKAPRLAGMLRIVAIGWPVSVQQSLAQLGLMIAFFIVAQLGTTGAAVINVLVNLTLLTIQSATGLGVAAATLVGHSLGRAAPGEARTWGWRTAAWGAVLTGPFGLAAAIWPEPLLRLFLQDPATLAVAVLPARLIGLTVAADTVNRVLCFAFRGAGATKIAAGVPFVSFWLVQLPLMWWVGVDLRQGVLGMVAIQVGLIVVEAVVLSLIWATRFWVPSPPGAPEISADLSGRVEAATRIAILGGAGSGKSTLARRLGGARGLPVIHLDRIVFRSGWSRNALDLVQEQLAEQLGEAWVVDGTYAEAMGLTLPQADLTLWLDQPAWLRLYRSWRKTRDHRGKPRADRPDDCEEGFTWRYALSILAFGRWTDDLERRLGAVAKTPVVRLRGDREVALMLAGLGQRPHDLFSVPGERAQPPLGASSPA